MLAEDGVSEGLLLGLFDAIDRSSAARSGLRDIPNFSRKDIVDDDLIDDAVLRLENEFRENSDALRLLRSPFTAVVVSMCSHVSFTNGSAYLNW
ncbi:uncharacterized protein RHO25_001917 [Cercospora beticola]|uniref:Uncharacterized protein n=1 Tax=Cercospora beticola TaxID=122368 RepID=A0ABZ0NCP7_CERBT|nr:hypothetical protein RHO25_001917 [Cercospora beticola]CAK1354273.1 unnamed protein product [Cercospora beticola]